MTKKNISDFLRSRGDAFDHPIFVSAAKVFDKGDLSEAAEFLTKRVGLEFPNAEVKNSYIEALFVLWKERGEDITGKSFPNEEKRRRFLKKTLSFQAKEIRKDGGLYGDSNA